MTTEGDCWRRRRQANQLPEQPAKETSVPRKIHAEIPIRATAQRIYQAWIEPAELCQWFSEHADVSTDEQRFHFWGRFQPDAPERDAAGQRLLAAEAPHHLRFDWRLAGIETTVDVRIEEYPAASRVIVRHEWLPESIADIVEAFWSLSIENLRGWIERGATAPRCDFTIRPAGEVRHSVDIDAAPGDVFRALTDPEQINRYMGGSATIEPQVGGTLDYGWGGHEPMQILTLEPEREFSHTWGYVGDEHAEGTIVTWTLAESGGKTQLTMVHSGFAPERSHQDYQVGWRDFINRIKFMVEGGPGWIRPNTHGMHREAEPVDTAVYGTVPATLD